MEEARIIHEQEKDIRGYKGQSSISCSFRSLVPPASRITNREISLSLPQDETRTVDSIYDALGAQVSTTLDTTEHDGPVRQFDYPYDLTTGVFTRVGPDLVETVTTLDEANRVESVVRRLPSGWFSRGLTGGSCFVAGTPVEPSSGPIAIEDVVVEGCVQSSDVASGGHSYAMVKKALEARGRILVNLRLPKETITCTPAHPFWVIGEGWVNAGDLRKGCELLSSDGRTVLVLGMSYLRPSRPVRVYNITVDEEHTYYVGESRVLVHNKQ